MNTVTVLHIIKMTSYPVMTQFRSSSGLIIYCRYIHRIFCDIRECTLTVLVLSKLEKQGTAPQPQRSVLKYFAIFNNLFMQYYILRTFIEVKNRHLILVMFYVHFWSKLRYLYHWIRLEVFYVQVSLILTFGL